MNKQENITLEAKKTSREQEQLVSILVSTQHPLLQLKRALPWEEITEVMIKQWRKAGKNVDGKRGQAWPVVLYVPLLVMMMIKHFHSRQMEEYVAESVVARVFIGWQEQTQFQVRDHANIARAMQALGAEGIEEINSLIINKAVEYGYADKEILSADTTAQELPIGYPNEPGILKGIAQRCLRAFGKLKKGTIIVATEIVEKAKTVLKLVKEHHLFAKTIEEKQELLNKIIGQTEDLMKSSTQIIESIGVGTKSLQQSAVKKLQEMVEVTKILIPQIQYWIKTGKVATGKILHSGITQAQSIVRNKSGKVVEFGFKYLINKIKGGYVFGTMLLDTSHETKMPLQSLADYRKIFGELSTPKILVYDRGGHSSNTIKNLTKQGVEKIGIQPKGKAQWLVSGQDRQTVKTERGKTEGIIGTLKSLKYGFNFPKQRNFLSLQVSGQLSILSLNFNTLLKDVSNPRASALKKVA